MQGGRCTILNSRYRNPQCIYFTGDRILVVRNKTHRSNKDWHECYIPHKCHSLVSAPQGKAPLSYVTAAGSFSSKPPCLHDLLQVSHCSGVAPQVTKQPSPGLWWPSGTEKRQLEVLASWERPYRPYLSVMFSSRITSREKISFWAHKGSPWKLRRWQSKHLQLQGFSSGCL